MLNQSADVFGALQRQKAKDVVIGGLAMQVDALHGGEPAAAALECGRHAIPYPKTAV